MSNSYTQDFPTLFESGYWGVVQYQFEIKATRPPDSLVANVSMTPYVGNEWVMLQLEDGTWDMPGGTLEPHETFLDTIHRELLEEAGANLLTFVDFGAFHCHSTAEKPYRPHLPHPKFYRVIGLGEVEIMAKPTNPPDGEQVVRVDVVPLSTLVERFLNQKRADLAALYQLAAQLRDAK